LEGAEGAGLPEGPTGEQTNGPNPHLRPGGGERGGAPPPPGGKKFGTRLNWEKSAGEKHFSPMEEKSPGRPDLQGATDGGGAGPGKVIKTGIKKAPNPPGGVASQNPGVGSWKKGCWAGEGLVGPGAGLAA